MYAKDKSFDKESFLPLQSFLQYHSVHLLLHPSLHYCRQRKDLLLDERKNVH